MIQVIVLLKHSSYIEYEVIWSFKLQVMATALGSQIITIFLPQNCPFNISFIFSIF